MTTQDQDNQSNQDQDHDGKKQCLGCGRYFLKTPEFYPGSTKRGVFRPRSRCHDCQHAQTTLANEDREARNGYGPVKGRPKWVTPPNLALGKAGQFRTCGEGEGLNVLTGPGNLPVTRELGVRLRPGEVCIVLG